MESTCQRCHETLHDGDRYCRACGLPQLIYLPSETPVVVIGAKTAAEGVPGSFGEFGGGIAWRHALRAALMLAIPVAILSYGVTPIGLLWSFGAAAWAVSLYAKRTGNGWPSMGTGARIGLVTGLFASWLTIGLVGINLWISRFLLHKGNDFDSEWLSSAQETLDRGREASTQHGWTSEQAAYFMQIIQSFHDTMVSVEGRAGLMLLSLLILVSIIVALATAGGALGARLLIRRPRSSA